MSEDFAIPEAASVGSSISDAVGAVTNAPEMISNAFEMVERVVYGTVYATAFAVTFPLALVIAALPTGNVISQGLADGSAEAIDRAHRMLGSDRLLG